MDNQFGVSRQSAHSLELTSISKQVFWQQICSVALNQQWTILVHPVLGTFDARFRNALGTISIAAIFDLALLAATVQQKIFAGSYFCDFCVFFSAKTSSKQNFLIRKFTPLAKLYIHTSIQKSHVESFWCHLLEKFLLSETKRWNWTETARKKRWNCSGYRHYRCDNTSTGAIPN